MDEYRNKVSKLHAIQSQNISKLLANQLEEPQVRGAMGGLPLQSLLAAVSSPPDRGWPKAHGPPLDKGPEEEAIPLGQGTR